MKKIIFFLSCMLVFFSACHSTKKLTNSDGNSMDKKNCKRVKLTVLEAFSKEQDKFTENDQFVTVVFQNQIILTTPVIQDMNLAKWKDQYVVFEYCDGDILNITQLDDDYTFHDVLAQYNGALKMGDMKLEGPLSYFKIKVEETKETLQSTHYSLPTNTMNLNEFLLSIKAKDNTFKGEYLRRK